MLNNNFMVQQNTILKVSDNSGAKTVKCIKVLGGFKKKIAKVGDIIVVSIQQIRKKINVKVKKKEVYQALLVRTKVPYNKKNGFKDLFFENSVILINKQGNPIGTRILGPLSRTLKKKKLQKILSISSSVI
jgi:large subunit ribosomal protein L14